MIGSETIENVHEMRDLGVILDEKLTFSTHVDAVLKKGNRALGLLIRSFQTGKKWSLVVRCEPQGGHIDILC